MNAATPPLFCELAMMCSVSVVLPEDSGPKISMTRPLGIPDPPNAMSSESDPVGMPSMGLMFSPSSFMTEPLPNCFSICWTARDSAESFAGSCAGTGEAALAAGAFSIDAITGFPGATVAVAVDDEEETAEEEDDATGPADFASAFSGDLATVGSFRCRRVCLSAGGG